MACRIVLILLNCLRHPREIRYYCLGKRFDRCRDSSGRLPSSRLPRFFRRFYKHLSAFPLACCLFPSSHCTAQYSLMHAPKALFSASPHQTRNLVLQSRWSRTNAERSLAALASFQCCHCVKTGWQKGAGAPPHKTVVFYG